MSSNTINGFNNYFDNLYPQAQRLYSASARFNCHSYAWYSQQCSNNIYWMNNPENYILDQTYYAVDTPRPGDIICYYDDNGTIDYIDDDENLHSGIVVTYDSTITPSSLIGGAPNQVVVRSKWGAAGLYEHNGDYCPYVYIPSIDLNASGKADYVKYYRPRSNDTISLSNPSTNTTYTINKNYTVPTPNNNTNNYVLYDLDISSPKNYDIEISSTSPLEVKLYNLHMYELSINTSTSYSNGVYYISIHRYFDVGHHYLRISYEDPDDYGTIFTEITNMHEHNIYGYQWLNLTSHNSLCICGPIVESHVVSASLLNRGSKFATCMLCGGIASINDILNGADNQLPYSLNGSYILPNGVIVLVDDDIESYFNGTLEFIYPNMS